jgi:hypothetical protein
MTPSSPTMIPLFGSPSVVNAQAFADSLRKEIFFGCKSACDANDFIASRSSGEGRQSGRGREEGMQYYVGLGDGPRCNERLT